MIKLVLGNSLKGNKISKSLLYYNNSKDENTKSESKTIMIIAVFGYRLSTATTVAFSKSLSKFKSFKY